MSCEFKLTASGQVGGGASIGDWRYSSNKKPRQIETTENSQNYSVGLKQKTVEMFLLGRGCLIFLKNPLLYFVSLQGYILGKVDNLKLLKTNIKQLIYFLLLL